MKGMQFLIERDDSRARNFGLKKNIGMNARTPQWKEIDRGWNIPAVFALVWSELAITGRIGRIKRIKIVVQFDEE